MEKSGKIGKLGIYWNWEIGKAELVEGKQNWNGEIGKWIVGKT
jgi:hypothetical protein